MGGFILRGDIEGLLGLRGNEAPPRVVPRLNFDSSGGAVGRHEEELLQEGGEERTPIFCSCTPSPFWEPYLYLYLKTLLHSVPPFWQVGTITKMAREGEEQSSPLKVSVG